MSTTLRLVDPAAGAELLNLSLWTDTAGRLLSLDLGYPAVRSASVARSGGHGVYDTTTWFGDRAITAVVQLPAAPADADRAVDTLAGLMEPNTRLWLYVRRDGWSGERRILVRGASFAAPPAVVRQAQMGWVAPLGLFEDPAATSVTLNPSGSGTGLSFPVTYAKTYGTGSVPGYAMVTVGGTVDAAPVIDMYGPCTQPSLQLIGGATLAFTAGLSIPAGSFVRVDMDARKTYLNGDPTVSEYSLLDFTVSQWWTLPPGPQQLLFSAQSAGPGCQAVVTWRNRTIAG